MNLKNLETFLNKVDLMNFLTNKANLTEINGDWYDSVRNQALRVIEEAQEIIDGCDNRSLDEILDGVVDTQVTALPLIGMLESVNFKVTDAMISIADNNLTKVTTDFNVAQATGCKLGESYCYIDSVVYNGETYYSVKRKVDNKYLKPIGYESPNLKEYLP